MNVDVVKNWQFPVVRQTYTEKDTILYALALGYGAQPTDQGQLRYVYEQGLMAVPTLGSTLCHPGFWVSDPRTGIDVTKVVHGEQKMRFHKVLPPKGSLRGEAQVLDVVDKGVGKGALLVFERKLYDDHSGDLIASIEQVTMCRGDGGFSSPTAGASKPAVAATGVAAVAKPDFEVEFATLAQAALIYRLCADPNPLHADPAVAQAAGFDRPILHGLCTYGIAARSIVLACCDNNAGLLRELSVRFSAPVFPGETIRTDIWKEDKQIRFRCVVPQRDVVVISNGIALLGTP